MPRRQRPWLTIVRDYYHSQQAGGGGIKDGTVVSVEDFSQDLAVEITVYHRANDDFDELKFPQFFEMGGSAAATPSPGTAASESAGAAASAGAGAGAGAGGDAADSDDDDDLMMVGSDDDDVTCVEADEPMPPSVDAAPAHEAAERISKRARAEDGSDTHGTDKRPRNGH